MFQEEVSQLLASYLQTTDEDERSVAGFAAWLQLPSGPTTPADLPVTES